MKVYLKSDPTQVGEVIDVRVTLTGQKRMTVLFKHAVKIDADVSEFELV